jgi:hypothetical protein
LAGHQLELIRWLDPVSSDCENARAGKALGLMRAVNVALDRSERDSTRWFKAWLECPDDSLPWPRRGALEARLRSGAVARSRIVIAAGEGLQFFDYYPEVARIESDRLHMLIGPRGVRSAMLLIGFPPAPDFQVSDIATLAVAGPATPQVRNP